MAKKKPGIKGTGKFKRERPSQHKKDRTPAEKKKRAARNAARNKLGLKKGDSRDAGHKKALSKGGSADKSNTKKQSRKSNRAAGGRMSKGKQKKKG